MVIPIIVNTTSLLQSASRIKPKACCVVMVTDLATVFEKSGRWEYDGLFGNSVVIYTVQTLISLGSIDSEISFKINEKSLEFSCFLFGLVRCNRQTCVKISNQLLQFNFVVRSLRWNIQNHTRKRKLFKLEEFYYCIPLRVFERCLIYPIHILVIYFISSSNSIFSRCWFAQ